MNQLLSIQDNKIVITDLVLGSTSGAITHTGSISVTESLTVAGELHAKSIRVENLISESGTIEGVGQWTSNLEADLNGKGFSWTYGDGSVNFQYRTGKKLWTNGNIDIARDGSYFIDGAAVLSANTLGAQITKSKLRELGILNSLAVGGDAVLGDFAFFSSNFNRLGINTENPNATLSVVENDIETVIGSQHVGSSFVGTFSNHDLHLGTDNTARITLKSGGDVIIGNETSMNSVVRIYGELIVEKLTSDTRTETISPIQFNATRSTPIYGLGLEWAGNGSKKQFVMKEGPDRLWSSESMDLAVDQCYYIDSKPVITATGLGTGVTSSNLTSVGNLLSLKVIGPTALLGDIDASAGILKSKIISFNDGSQQVSIDNQKINSSNSYSINVQNQEALYVDPTEITIGNSANTRRPVKVFGQLSVGITNPDPKVALAVNGNASFSNRTFVSGTAAPVSGIHNKGDICWNDNPVADNYVGWICIVSGEPGEWLPFGAINRQ